MLFNSQQLRSQLENSNETDDNLRNQWKESLDKLFQEISSLETQIDQLKFAIEISELFQKMKVDPKIAAENVILRDQVATLSRQNQQLSRQNQENINSPTIATRKPITISSILKKNDNDVDLTEDHMLVKEFRVVLDKKNDELFGLYQRVKELESQLTRVKVNDKLS